MPVDTIITVAVISDYCRKKEEMLWTLCIEVNLFLHAVSTWPLAMPYSTSDISNLTNSSSHTEK